MSPTVPTVEFYDPELRSNKDRAGSEGITVTAVMTRTIHGDWVRRELFEAEKKKVEQRDREIADLHKVINEMSEALDMANAKAC
jgi:uncharacterized NAD(P)/FAD-binding protein YdhS